MGDMAIYYERVGRGMQLLRDGLRPFVEAAVPAALARRAYSDARQDYRPIGERDAALLLAVMEEDWKEAFRQRLGHAERGLVPELRDWRSKSAHQELFTRDDAYRALDSAERPTGAIA